MRNLNLTSKICVFVWRKKNSGLLRS